MSCISTESFTSASALKVFVNLDVTDAVIYPSGETETSFKENVFGSTVYPFATNKSIAFCLN